MNYKIVRDFIKDNLLKKNEVLKSKDILDEVEKYRLLLSNTPQALMLIQLSNDEFDMKKGVKEIDWINLKNELEMNFNVIMEPGISLIDSNADRDIRWWTNGGNQKSPNYYWLRYREYLKKSLPSGVVNTIDDDTDMLMNHIEDPKIKKFQRLGMVVGHVQSGKTSNYAGLVCKAADAGYKFIVVIAGGMNNLRDQTQKRLLESFVGSDSGKQVGVGLGNQNLRTQPISLTTIHKDFNKQDADKNAQGNNFDNTSVPILIVIKKNTSILKNVLKWLKSHYPNKINHSMLLIDDESDYASINTKEDDNPTAINKAIRNLLNHFNQSSYVAYTATPYANIFIDHTTESEDYGKDLFPKDYIYALDAPTNYFGAKKVFVLDEDEERKSIVEIDDNEVVLPLKHKKGYKIEELPKSLEDAVRLFVLNVGIRYLRGDVNKHNSMLIHISRFTNMHQQMREKINLYLTKLERSIDSFILEKNSYTYDKYIKELFETYNKYYSLGKIEEEWDDIRFALSKTTKTIVIREVHQLSKIPLEYVDNSPTNAIVIGGASLSRGFTIEGLSVSYFLRTTIYYDTLMQMGRWFGYRPGYEDLCKIYMTGEMADNFEHIVIATDELISKLKKMSEENRTPKEFGLAIRQHPESALQITARNKQKNAKDFIVEMNLEGTLKQTTWLTRNQNEIKENTRLFKNLISKYKTIDDPKGGKRRVINNVLSCDVLELISKFKAYSVDDEGFFSHFPVKFIKKYIEESGNWDVGIFSGNGDEIELTDKELNTFKIKRVERKIAETKDGSCYKLKMLSGPADEGITLNESEMKRCYSVKKKKTKKEENKAAPRNGNDLTIDRLLIREKLKRPLLMLYFLKGNEKGEVNEVMPALGISFPNDGKGESKVVRLKINTVALENMGDWIEDNEE